MPDEIAAEHRTFKPIGPVFLHAFDFKGRARTASLREAMAILANLDGDGRKPLPVDVPLEHIERSRRQHVLGYDGIDRTHWEPTTYSGLHRSRPSFHYPVDSATCYNSEILDYKSIGEGQISAEEKIPICNRLFS